VLPYLVPAHDVAPSQMAHKYHATWVYCRKKYKSAKEEIYLSGEREQTGGANGGQCFGDLAFEPGS
jgi:hypothetical protein